MMRERSGWREGFEPSVPRSRKGLPFWRRGVGRVTDTTRGGPETVST
jgi:hypothetical protein